MIKYTLLLLIFFNIFAVQMLADFKISTLGNKIYTGKIIKFDNQKQEITFSTKINQHTLISCKDIIKVENAYSNANVRPQNKIVLADGSIVYGKIIDGSAESIGVETNLLGLITLDLIQIKDLFFGNFSSQEINTSENDILYFKSGDVMEGIIEKFGNDYVQIEHEQLGSRKEAFSKLKRISFAELEVSKKNNSFVTNIIGFDESSLIGRITRISSEKVSFQMENIEEKREISLKKIKYIFFKNGRFSYVSDLPSNISKIEYIPYFPNTLAGDVVKKDKNYSGNPLVIRGQRFYKGLGTISKTKIHLRLNKKYKRFQSVIGIDDEIAQRYKRQSNFIGGSVVFKVIADKKTIYKSDIVYHFTPSINIDVDVSNKETLTLVVDFGDNAHVNDYADWGEAILVR